MSAEIRAQNMIRDLIYFETRVEERDEILIPLLFSGNSVIEHFTCDMGQLISNLFPALIDTNTYLQL